VEAGSIRSAGEYRGGKLAFSARIAAQARPRARFGGPAGAYCGVGGVWYSGGMQEPVGVVYGPFCEFCGLLPETLPDRFYAENALGSFGAKYLIMQKILTAKFKIGQVVKHRLYPFRGVVFDIDPVFDNTEEWWESIPTEVRPRKDQPFYHLFAENAESEYVAYVSEQNLLPDTSEKPIRHPMVEDFMRDFTTKLIN
jgi:heat shock protein HspQ